MTYISKNFTIGQDEFMYFINSAYSEYKAARNLLLNNHLVQGSILASASLEKYLKSIVCFHTKCPPPKTHEITSKKLLRPVKQLDRKLYNNLNIEFIHLLSNCYKLRYLDSIKKGYNIVLSKNRTLAEIDFIVNKVENNFSHFQLNLRKFERQYHRDLDAKLDGLFLNNHILNGIKKSVYINGKLDLVYECRALNTLHLLEATYKTQKTVDEKRFLIPGLVHNEVLKHTDLAYEPLNKKVEIDFNGLRLNG